MEGSASLHFIFKRCSAFVSEQGQFGGVWNQCINLCALVPPWLQDEASDCVISTLISESNSYLMLQTHLAFAKYHIETLIRAQWEHLNSGISVGRWVLQIINHGANCRTACLQVVPVWGHILCLLLSQKALVTIESIYAAKEKIWEFKMILFQFFIPTG